MGKDLKITITAVAFKPYDGQQASITQVYKYVSSTKILTKISGADDAYYVGNDQNLTVHVNITSVKVEEI